MNLTFNDISVGDIYEHIEGGFYQVTEILDNHTFLVGNKLNAIRPKDVFHSIDQIKNFFGKFKN